LFYDGNKGERLSRISLVVAYKAIYGGLLLHDEDKNYFTFSNIVAKT